MIRKNGQKPSANSAPGSEVHLPRGKMRTDEWAVSTAEPNIVHNTEHFLKPSPCKSRFFVLRRRPRHPTSDCRIQRDVEIIVEIMSKSQVGQRTENSNSPVLLWQRHRTELPDTGETKNVQLSTCEQRVRLPSFSAIAKAESFQGSVAHRGAVNNEGAMTNLRTTRYCKLTSGGTERGKICFAGDGHETVSTCHSEEVFSSSSFSSSSSPCRAPGSQKGGRGPPATFSALSSSSCLPTRQ